MNSQEYIGYIEMCLSILATRIDCRAKLNVLDLNIYAETFYAEIINLVFGYNVKNANIEKHNNAGYDLIDSEQRIVIQVTSNTKKDKVQKTIESLDIQQYAGYKLVMLYIGNGKCENSKSNISKHIKPICTWDKEFLLKAISAKRIEEQKKIYQCFKKYFDRGDGSLAVDIVSRELEIETLSDIDEDYYFDVLYGNRISYFANDLEDFDLNKGARTLHIRLQNVGNKAIRRIAIKEFIVVDSLEADAGEIYGSMYCKHSEKKYIESLIPMGKSEELIIDFDTAYVYEYQSDSKIQIRMVMDISVNESETEELCMILILEKIDGTSQELDYLEGKYIVKYKKIY